MEALINKIVVYVLYTSSILAYIKRLKRWKEVSASNKHHSPHRDIYVGTPILKSSPARLQLQLPTAFVFQRHRLVVQHCISKTKQVLRAQRRQFCCPTLSNSGGKNRAIGTTDWICACISIYVLYYIFTYVMWPGK